MKHKEGMKGGTRVQWMKHKEGMKGTRGQWPKGARDEAGENGPLEDYRSRVFSTSM